MSWRRTRAAASPCWPEEGGRSSRPNQSLTAVVMRSRAAPLPQLVRFSLAPTMLAAACLPSTDRSGQATGTNEQEEEKKRQQGKTR
eukprot:6517308-Prymnesium_polylepis.1